MRKFWLIFIAPLVVFVLFMSLLKWVIVPWSSHWALDYIKSWTAKNGPVTVSAARVEVKFFRPTVDIIDVEIESHTELNAVFKKITVDRVSFQLDLFQIFTGRLQVSTAIVQHLQAVINIDPFLKDNTKPQEIPLREIFNNLEQIPVQRVWIEKMDLQLDSEKNKSSLHLKSASLIGSLDSKFMRIKADFESGSFYWQEKAPSQFSFKTQLSMTRDTLNVSSAEITLGKSSFRGSALMDSVEKLLITPQGQIEGLVQLDFAETDQFIRTYWPQLRFAHLAGRLSAETKIALKGFDDIQGNVELKTEAVQVAQFDLGDTVIRGHFKDQSIQLDEVNAHHPAGSLKLTKANITLRPPWNFDTRFDAEKLDLQKLFQSLKLNQIPVDLLIQGRGNCAGRIENLQVKCQADLLGSNLLVQSSRQKDATTIVEIQNVGAVGEVSIDMNKVTYNSQIFLGRNKGQSQGQIEYAKGFRVQFQSPEADFKNIKNLANLKFEGITPIDGFTEGNASAAILKMKMRPQNFVFENHQLGTLETELSYEKGHIQLNQITGQLGQTKYLGKIDIDLHNKEISGSLNLPQVELNDVATAFARIYQLPFNVQGVGSADLNFHGPFSFWNLSYELKSQFKNGRVATETFTDLFAHIKSQQGFVKAEQLSLTKGTAKLNVTASLTPEKIIDLQARAQNFKLEESEFITRINTQIYGMLNLTSNLKGSLLHPDFDLSGTLSETILSDQEVANSFFSLSTNAKQTIVNAAIFGNRVQTEITLPREGTLLPIKLRVKTSDWHYGPLLALLGGTHLQNEYETNLTSEVDLTSTSGDWNRLSGAIKVQNALLKRGPLLLKNTNPLVVAWDNGNLSIKNLELEGPQNLLSARGGPFTFQNMDVTFNANVELRLFQLFLPFLDDLGGPLEAQANLSGSWNHPKILGHAKILSSFFKLKGFPHPFEKIKTDVTFSHTKILVPQIQGMMGGGRLEGSGEIQINGINDIPTSFRFTAEGLNLTVPDKIRTSGSAEITISGKWFPFTLAGIYRIQSGLFEKEFGEFSSNSLAMQQSRYLPQTIKEASFEPITLDLQLNLERNVLVKNSMMEGLVYGQLQVRGIPQNPIVTGKIETDKNTKITFKDKIFDVQTGQVNFNNPQENNPELFLSARSRVQDYDISLIVQGLAKNPSLRLTSTPPLAENDIISLLALGITSTKLEQNVQSAEQAKQTATEVFGSVLNQTVGRGFQNTTGFNIQVSNSYDSTKNISVPKLTFKRQLGRKTSVQLSRLISSGGDTNDVKIQYELNQNLSAVGSFESRNNQESTTEKTQAKDQQSIFGLDLVFRREFK